MREINSSSWHKRHAHSRTVSRVLAGTLGLILLIAAALKATDMELFIRQIKDYDIISNGYILTLTAWILITLECGLGAGLLISYRPRFILSLTGLLLLVFLGATASAWLGSATEHCGCFGAWMKHSPGEAAIGNIVLLIATVLAWMGCLPSQATQSYPKGWVVVAACLIGLVLPLIFGFPISGFVQPTPETSRLKLGDLQVRGIDYLDLAYGTYLITLMGTQCEHCQEAVPQLNMLAESGTVQAVVALCTSEELECLDFVEAFQPIFPIGQISEEMFWQLLGDGDIPRFILVRDQHVRHVWDQGVPNEEMIEAALID